MSKKVVVTGGAGYVGAVLIPKLLKKGHQVKVIDLYIYGENVLDSVKNDPNLIQVKGDIRDREMLDKEIKGYDTVIHLACISNDPSYELNPELGKSINYDAFLTLVDVCKKHKVKHFIFASSSSVYGVKQEKDVTEEMSREPLTDYSKYKALCEDVLLKEATDDFIVTIVRPSTVCGYSPRLRLDLTVNILTNHAVNKGEITVFGGDQMRPNIHIEDITDFYVLLLDLPTKKLQKKIYNCGFENYKVKDIAEMIKKVIDPKILIKVVPTDDNRSYHVSSKKVKNELGFEAKRSIEDAVKDLKKAFDTGKIPGSMQDKKYYNIKVLQSIDMNDLLNSKEK